jgi:hypothetical protein
MFNREEILAGLHTIANRAEALASFWHTVAIMALLAVAVGWRPTRRTIAALLVPPLASVAAMAWVFENPFNAAAFTVLALVLGFLALRIPALPPDRPAGWARGLGAAMVGLGLVYPHFLDTSSWLWYLYAAPTGLLPCPTLSLAIGVTLLADGLGARAFSLLLAVVGLCYGVVGVVRLGVALDVGLILGAAGLLARWLGPNKRA